MGTVGLERGIDSRSGERLGNHARGNGSWNSER